MRDFSAKLLRNHWHALLVIPLVVIVMTWPAFPRIFDADEFWLHVNQQDLWYKFWDAWHLDRVLAGHADYYFTDTIFHPRGVSLAFHQISLPHALLMLVLQNILPADDAYNLLFLLILCFNGFSAYLLAQHLIDDKWIALFGALVAAVATPFPFRSTLPDLITLGTIPLSIYFLHRSIAESRWRFAALAGISTGLTAFIGIYIFLIHLMTVGIYTCFLAFNFWRKRTFWRALILLFAACGFISFFRLYPMIADNTHNPFTGPFLHNLFKVPPDSRFHGAYLGFINLLLLASAVLFSRNRRKLAPWLTMLFFFAALRLGRYLSFNGADYRDIPLPEHYLGEWLPTIFRLVPIQEYYQIGVVLPLAILSCFGLRTLLHSKPTRIRVALVFVSAFILAIEFYVPPRVEVLKREKTAFIDWLRAQSDSPDQLVHLPRERPTYFLYLQTITEYPHIYGQTNNVPPSNLTYIRSNPLLEAWHESRSIHCLRHNLQEFITALERLLEGGSTYILVHKWRMRAEHILPSFANVPALYDNGFVSIYRLRDMRLSCQNQGGDLPQFTHLAQSSWAIPGLRASIVSFHPNQSMAADDFHYLGSLFSDWESLLHVYEDEGEVLMQNKGTLYEDVGAFANENRIVYLVYDANHSAESPTNALKFLDRFNLCRREAHDDGSVIELYLKPDFSCELYASDAPFRVRYDNGARLENLLSDLGQDYLDLQLRWGNYPKVSHSISFQLFDAAGAKVAGQDYVVSRTPVARHKIDISHLPAGDYSLKIVYYNFETVESVPGTISGSGESFERELAIASIRKR